MGNPKPPPPTLATAKTTGERIIAAYLQKGLNRSAFARALGVAYSTIIAWEKGVSNPSMVNLEGIAAVTGVPVDELVPGHQPSDESMPADVAAFLKTPFGQETTAEERSHLLGYYRKDGPIRDYDLMTSIVLQYRAVQRGKNTSAGALARARSEGDEARREIAESGFVTIGASAPKGESHGERSAGRARESLKSKGFLKLGRNDLKSPKTGQQR